jgi:SNF2 family DNA or RNA helicase
MNNSEKEGIPDCNLPLTAGRGNPHNTLKSHQEEIVDLMHQGNLAIFAEAGTGKTMIALKYLYDALIAGEISDALVVCPSSLVANWRSNIDKMTLFGFSDAEVEMMHDAVYITSYRRTWVAKKGWSVILRDDVDKAWGALIIDESHRLGTHNSLQTKACIELAKRSSHRYVMTGTPDSTKYTKLYGQIKVLDPDKWPKYRDFYKRIVIAEDYFRNPKTYDVELCEALKRQYGVVARLRDCFDMPDKVEEDITVQNLSKKVYDDIHNGLFEKHGITLMGAGTGHGKLLQICSGHLITDEGTKDLKTEKLDATLELIEGTEGKVVIFATYRRSIDQICAMLDANKISHHRYDGTTDEPVWRDFQKDESKAIVVQYQRGLGIDLYASNVCIFYEPTYSAVDLEQAQARIMRIGQTKKCIYYYLTTADTIEVRAWRSVRSGVDISTKLLDEWAREGV